MSWELSEEHEALRAMVREFAEAEIAPNAAQVGRRAPLPGRRRAKMGELGLVRDRVPRRVRRRRRRLRLAVRGDRGAGPRRPVDGHHALGRRRAGRQPDLPVRHRRPEATLAARSRRRARLGGFGLTEPDGGSDAGATRTRAVLDRARLGDRRLEGVHHQLRHADHVDHTVTARTDEGISAFVVPAGTPGLIIEPPYHKLGWHASDTHGITLDGLPGAGVSSARPAGPGLPQLPDDP